LRLQQLRDSTLAGASFALTVFLFEAALYAPATRPGAPSYLGAAAALTIALVLAVAVIATLATGRFAPLVTVVTMAAATVLGAGVEIEAADAWRAVAVASVLALSLRLDRDLRQRPMAMALIAAAAVCAAFRIWPTLCDEIAPCRGARDDWAGHAMGLLVFAGCMASAIGYATLRRRRSPRLPGAPFVATTALALATILTIVAETVTRLPRSTSDLSLEASTAGERPSILVLLLDTVGAGRLSIYGHSRDTTPELRKFLDASPRAVLYPLAFAPASWTVPSHASLLTGLLPTEHGIEHARRGEEWPRREHRLLGPTLRGLGYRTAAIIANPRLLYAPEIFAGFDSVQWPPPMHGLRLTPGEHLRARWFSKIGDRAVKPSPPAEAVNREVLDHVRQCGDGPCLVFANYMDAHAPYAPPPSFAGTWEGSGRDRLAEGKGAAIERAAARHDESLLGLDAALGALLAELDRSGALDRWWLVITSDHGEAFGEHGFNAHGKGLHVEQTRIPLLVQPPLGERLEVRRGPVSLVDVGTTLAAVAGVADFGGGDDLRRPPTSVPVVGMEFAGREWSGVWVPRARGVVVGQQHLIESEGRRELYDLDEDPLERNDLAAAARDEVERLAALLPPGFSVADEAPADFPGKDAGEDERRGLRALGYLD
jgi:arylsulfatase A-like enzyme